VQNTTDQYPAPETAQAANGYDESAPARKAMIQTGQPARDLAADTGQRWTTEELSRDFTVISFGAPFVVVRRKSDDAVGTLEFTHSPRVYFGWQEAS
jgi:hypothetical protein